MTIASTVKAEGRKLIYLLEYHSLIKNLLEVYKYHLVILYWAIVMDKKLTTCDGLFFSLRDGI